MLNILATSLPIGEHWWTVGPAPGKTSFIAWNLHADTVIMTLIGMAILLAIGLTIRARITSGVPGRLQNAIEMVVEFINDIITENLGSDPGTIGTISLTLFFFIWTMNMIGLMPFPYFHSPTADVSVTFALALLVFVLMHYRYVKTSGFSGYKGHYWTSGPKAILLNPASVGLALITEISRPLTLSFRLFGNIFAGEILLIVFAAILPLTFGFIAEAVLNPLILIFFGLFVGTIQAFIFTVLTVAYMSIAGQTEEHH
jgi:F-type H+-transporting ATPase subunit a